MSITERHGELSRWRERDPQGFANWQQAQIEAAMRRPIGSGHIPIVQPEGFMPQAERRNDDRRGADRDTLKRHEYWITEHTEKLATLVSNYEWIKETLVEIQALITSTSDRVLRIEDYLEKGICPDIAEMKQEAKDRADRAYLRGTKQRDRTLVVVSLMVALVVGIGGWFF